MIKVFFSGYAWWYDDFKRSNGELPMVLDSDCPMIFPFLEHQDNDRTKPVRTVGDFYLEQTDEITFLRTNKTNHIKNLYPCPNSDPKVTFPKMVIEHAIGSTSIPPEDCIVVIDYEQDPILIFPNENKSVPLETKNSDKLTDTKPNKPIKKKPKQHKLRRLIWKVYQYLLEEGKTSTAQAVWDEIRHRHEIHDDYEIIEEVTADVILWNSPDSNDAKLKRGSMESTLSKLRKEPPF